MATSESGDFEKALGRLEEIVQKLERENVSLDDSVALFKEGKVLAARCEELLKVAQSAIETAAAPPAAAPVSSGTAAPATLFSRDP
jgi:exodeoxyribonuclease VII small subunit